MKNVGAPRGGTITSGSGRFFAAAVAVIGSTATVSPVRNGIPVLAITLGQRPIPLASKPVLQKPE
jgi:hypothetical protein